ncbi:MAG: hypothetical protein ACYCY9_05660 [Thiobacillus sp.]
MSTIIESYKQAELALAAYSNLTPGISGKPYTDALEANGNGMASAQASAFAATWNVVDQYTDPTTGVSATVFQAVAGGPKYLAIRGTGGLDDIGADIDLAVGLPLGFNLQYIALKTQVATWLADGTLVSGFTVSGHSLGGYLAVGLEADFSGSIGQAYLYNAPGLNGVLGSVTGAILDTLGITAPIDPSKISNIKADAGTSPIAGLGAQVAPAVTIHIEDQFFSDVSNPPGSYNHSQRVLTDSLALYAAYAQVDSTASDAGNDGAWKEAA